MSPFQRQRAFVVDLRLPEKRCHLDEVEQASVKLVKDGSPVMCNKSAANNTHSTCVGTVSRRRYD